MKLLLIDGYYYAYRSFFAIRDLSNSRGEPTNAIYGFTRAVRRMIRDLQPDLGAVVWDEGLPTRRTQLQTAYKQNRAEMPDALSAQIETIHAMVPLIGMHGVSTPDTEADDLIATYAHAARARGIDVVLATNDKDLFQLVAEGVKIYSTNKTDLASPKDTHALLDRDAVVKKWGVEPQQIGEVLCFIGDSVDNIPGVPGIGEKGAVALLREHGSLDAILNNPDAVKSEKTREKIKAAREQLLQNREMVRLDLDLPMPVKIDDLKIAPRYPDFIAALEKCEFKTLTHEVRVEAEKAAVRSGEGAGQGMLF